MSRNRVVLAHNLPMPADQLEQLTRAVDDSGWYFPADTAALAEELADRHPFLVSRTQDGLRVEVAGGGSFCGATLHEALEQALDPSSRRPEDAATRPLA